MLVTPKTKARTMFSAVLMVVAVAVVVFAWQYIHKAGEELTQQILTVVGHTDREQKYRELSRLVDGTAADREELGMYILTEEETIDFITQGEQIAAAQGVVYTTDSLTREELTGPFDRLIVAFTMEGAEEDVEHMLKILEKTPRQSQLTKLSINRAKLVEEGVVTARVELVVTLRKI